MGEVIDVKGEYERFNQVAKLMNKTEISKVPSTLASYRAQIIPAYNTFVSFICDHYSSVEKRHQEVLEKHLDKAKEVFVKCLNNLKCVFELPSDKFTQVNESKIGEVHSAIQSNQTGMTHMSSVDLLDRVNRQFSQKFSGDPLGLTSFLDGVKILRRFATTDELETDLVDYLKSKLDGRAREVVSDEIDTVDEMIDVLRCRIKPENSRVIEGRFAALRYSFAKEDEFSEKAEKLAEALRRTLIVEGITPEKANEMTIRTTVDLCRRSTSSSLVKSALISKSFSDPKDVIATLVVENGSCVREQQILKIEKMNRDRRGGQNNGKFNQSKQNRNRSNYSNGNNSNG